MHLSRDIHLPIQRYPSAYPEISIYLSIDIHLPIQRYPDIYPALFLIRFGWSCWPLRAAAVIAVVLHLRKQPLAGAGSWLIEARRRCGRAGRSQTTERNDSWASSGDDSWPLVVARHGGHHGGPCAGVRRRRRRRRRRRLLRRPIQDCQ
jgi:hypothetical protein